MALFYTYLLVSMVVLAAFCQDLGQAAITLKPAGDHIVVKNGTSLEIICSADEEVHLYHYTKKVSVSQNDQNWKCPGLCNLKVESLGAGQRYTLSIKDVQADHAGQYICKRTDTDTEQKKIMVYVASIIPNNGTLIDEGKPVTISCDMVKLTGVSMSFAKDGKPIETDNHYTFDAANRSLTINNPSKKDVGPYQCVFKSALIETAGLENITGTVFLLGGPFVKDFERPSKNLVEEDSTSINCKVFGQPTPKVAWYKGEVKLEVNATFNFSSFEGVPNATLMLKDLKQFHRGDYMCVAEIDGKFANATLLIRVKDKYAALWPFLGIVAEVVIVCAIIFIYEKKRGKRSDDDDAPPTKTNAHDQKSEDVRQRNVKT